MMSHSLTKMRIRAIYAIVVVCIKSAACVLFLRIAGPLRSYGILVVTVVGFVVTEVETIGECRPIQANWKVLQGAKCASQETVVVIAGFSTLTTVLTDWLCAMFPVYMLRRTSMPVRKKLAAGFVMGLGALATICTLLRIPYILHYGAAIAGDSKHGLGK